MSHPRPYKPEKHFWPRWPRNSNEWTEVLVCYGTILAALAVVFVAGATGLSPEYIMQWIISTIILCFFFGALFIFILGAVVSGLRRL